MSDSDRDKLTGFLTASLFWILIIAMVDTYYQQEISIFKYKAVGQGAGGYESGEFKLYEFQYVKTEGDKEWRIYRKDVNEH